jgi:DNA replication and repair protein RecF
LRLTRLSLVDFRNYRRETLEFPADVNVLVGPNAQGKTNVLEGIYLLGAFKSFRTSHNRDLIRLGAEQALVAGTAERDGLAREIEVTVGETGRRARVNTKPVRTLREFFGVCPVILFAPEDLAQVKGPPAMRRRFLDRAVFAGWPAYLPALQAYLGAVQQKQALLRLGHGGRAGAAPAADTTREAWDEALVRHGVEVIRRRARLAADLAPHLARAYRQLAGADAGEATLTYRPGAAVDPDAPPETLEAQLAAAVSAAARAEQRRGMVLVGPHRDELVLALDGRDLRHLGSQGEQRSFVVALKLAELALLTERLGTTPLFLLDDVASELDAARRRGLLAALAAAGAQVFLTTTEAESGIAGQPLDFQVFSVQNGGVESGPRNRLTPGGPQAITLQPTRQGS